MLQSKQRTRKLQRKELANYKKLVKMLDTNLGLLVQRGLYWKGRADRAENYCNTLVRAAEAAKRAQKPSGLIIL